MENGPFIGDLPIKNGDFPIVMSTFIGDLPIKMVMFYSYLSLPEGNSLGETM